MAAVNLTINSQSHTLDVDADTPLLWVLRDHLNLTGTKYGCGVAQCGACTVHVNGTAMRSCSLPVGYIDGADVVTIEGLAHEVKTEQADHPLQQVWVELNVPQCGYCQAGMLMAAADLLKKYKQPTDEQIDMHMSNICRCGTYPRVREAIHQAAAKINS